MCSFLTATDGKAPIATVEEEDDDVPGRRWSIFAPTFWIVFSFPFDFRLTTCLFLIISDLVENFDEASKDEAN